MKLYNRRAPKLMRYHFDDFLGGHFLSVWFEVIFSLLSFLFLVLWYELHFRFSNIFKTTALPIGFNLGLYSAVDLFICIERISQRWKQRALLVLQRLQPMIKFIVGESIDFVNFVTLSFLNGQSDIFKGLILPDQQKKNQSIHSVIIKDYGSKAVVRAFDISSSSSSKFLLLILTR